MWVYVSSATFLGTNMENEVLGDLTAGLRATPHSTFTDFDPSVMGKFC